jgi:hypothetical protein
MPLSPKAPPRAKSTPNSSSPIDTAMQKSMSDQAANCIKLLLGLGYPGFFAAAVQNEGKSPSSGIGRLCPLEEASTLWRMSGWHL